MKYIKKSNFNFIYRIIPSNTHLKFSFLGALIVGLGGFIAGLIDDSLQGEFNLQLHHLFMTKHYIPLAFGSIVGLIGGYGYGILIKEQKKIQQQFHNVKCLYQQVVESSFSSIAIIDNRGAIKFVNDNLLHLSGFTKSEILEQPFSNLILGGNIIINSSEDLDVQSNIIRMETSLIVRTGETIPIELSKGKVENTNQYLITINDLRTQKALTEEVIRFRRYIQDKIFLSYFKLSDLGMKIAVTEDLPFLPKDRQSYTLTYTASLYSAAIGQGANLHVGLYGPLPLPGINKFQALIYAFIIDDPTYLDPRSGGKVYSFFVVYIPNELLHLFSNKERITTIFKEKIENISTVQEINLDLLQKLKLALIGL